MGKQEKLLNQIFELKLTSKSLQRQARKCSRQEKAENLKIKKAIEKGNMDGARIHAENSIRKRSEQTNCLRLSARLDGVASRLDSQAQMEAIGKSMGGIVKTLESALADGNVEKVADTMDEFDRRLEDVEVYTEFMDSAMAGSTSLSTPEAEVDSLLLQVADDCRLEVSVRLPRPGARPIPSSSSKEEEDGLSSKLAELNAKG